MAYISHSLPLPLHADDAADWSKGRALALCLLHCIPVANYWRGGFVCVCVQCSACMFYFELLVSEPDDQVSHCIA